MPVKDFLHHEHAVVYSMDGKQDHSLNSAEGDGDLSSRDMWCCAQCGVVLCTAQHGTAFPNLDHRNTAG